MSVKMIAAVSTNGIIGCRDKNDIPWKGEYPEDFKFFREMTTGGTVIYGRNTFESMGSKLLPKRENIIITRSKIDGISCFESLEKCFQMLSLRFEDRIIDRWLCGGAEIYREGMNFADEIYITLIPRIIEGKNLISFPWINPLMFELNEIKKIPRNEKEYLNVLIYKKLNNAVK